VPFDRQLFEAKLALNLIASADMPRIALDALEAGIDWTATRRLAALERPTYFEVARGSSACHKEWEIVQIPIGEAALRMTCERSQPTPKGRPLIMRLQQLSGSGLDFDRSAEPEPVSKVASAVHSGRSSCVPAAIASHAVLALLTVT
jgi:hypothetical protein